MRSFIRSLSIGALKLLPWLLPVAAASGQPPYEAPSCILPEQRHIQYRSPDRLHPAAIPDAGAPKTVASYSAERQEHRLSLDEALQIALQNADVIRVLSGNTASSTGRTIYDPAITNTGVDRERSTFDPSLDLSNTYDRLEALGVAGGPSIGTIDTERYQLGMGLSKNQTNGDQFRLGVDVSPTETVAPGLGLNPRTPSAVEFSYTHPLLRGRGTAVNLAPVVIARIDTERSFYQLKDSVQDLVRSVIDGYWRLVLARVDLWAQQQQVEQLGFAYDRFHAQQRVGLGDIGDTAQAEVSLQQFQANVITAEAAVLDIEAALLNALGLPPLPDVRLIPVTPPRKERVTPDWDGLVAAASELRPDVVERKLAIETIRQQLLVANNDTLPQLDTVGVYRVNGLGGKTPNNGVIRSSAFQSTDVILGLNLDLPLGQRRARADLRQQQLALAREQAFLRQRLHAITHDLAQNVRNLDQFYAQYNAFQKVREASRVNLDRRFRVFAVGGLPNEQINYVNVLLAVTDWGNAVRSEARSLTQYNSELARIQQQTGTILEEHGILFQEERYRSLGPRGRKAWGWPGGTACYPEATPPTTNVPRYETDSVPAEQSFDLESPIPEVNGSEESQELLEALPAPPPQGDELEPRL